MPQRLRLKAPRAEDLLAQIHTELGPNARIVEARKVRRGGIGGFFAKERYEMCVEIDDEAEPDGDEGGGEDSGVGESGRVGRPLSMTELMERVDAGERNVAVQASAAAEGEHGPVPASGPISLPASEPVSGPVSGSVSGPTSGTDPWDEARAPDERRSEPTFAQILSRFAPNIAPVDETGPAVAEGGEPSSNGEPRYSFQPGGAAMSAGIRGATATATEPTPGPSTHGPLIKPQLTAAPTHADPVRSAYQVPSGPPSPATALLLGVGVPAELLTGDDSLSGVLDRLPPAPRPPAEAGAILVVVGDGRAAYEHALYIARMVRTDETNVLVAAPGGGVDVAVRQKLSGPEDAARREVRLRKADTPTIVAIDAPVDPEAARWVSSMLEALAADTVWGVVDATRKVADIRAWLSRVGPVEALAVVNLAATTDPAAVLGLGLPIVSLDGARATKAAWMAVLGDRLEPEEQS